MISKRIAGAWAVIVLMVFPAAAASMEPMAVLKAPIDNVIAILNDPQYKAAGTRVAQRDEIWKNVQAMFDFDEISRRTVARNWKRFYRCGEGRFHRCVRPVSGQHLYR
jgi:ABC-type transporter MlaC component